MTTFAVFGAGFWARFQLAAWQEIADATCVAICDPQLAKAQALAAMFNIPAVYTTPQELLQHEQIDFVDIISSVETHTPLVQLAAAHGLPVICQKPMALSLADAEAMVATCQAARVPFFVHENFRWQTPIRALKRVLDDGQIGQPFRARLDFISGFPVFNNQPFLKEIPQFIITDVGSHTLDIARFLFGEAQHLYAATHQIHRDIAGEDVATIMLAMAGVTVLCEMAYAGNVVEREHFPQTLIFVEGTKGSVELTGDYCLRVTTADGTHSKRYPPTHYAWADPAYDVVQASIVPCNANLLRAIRGEGQAETTGADNLETMRLVFGAYASAASRQPVMLPTTHTR